MKIAPSLLALASMSIFGVACKNNKTASNDPYSGNTHVGDFQQHIVWSNFGPFDFSNFYTAGLGSKIDNRRGFHQCNQVFVWI